MDPKTIEHCYTHLKEANLALSQALGITFFEASYENLQNLANQEILVRDGQPDAKTAEQLTHIYSKLAWEEAPPRERWEAIRLLLLEGQRDAHLPVNMQMTPTAVAVLVGFMLNTLAQKQGLENFHLFDPVVGMGNLLLTVQDTLKEAAIPVRAVGYDSEELLLGLTEQTSRLIGAPLELFFGDVLNPLLLEPVDGVVADLPIGYYPNKEGAQKFKTVCFETPTGLPFAHYLLIEQALHYLKPGGLALFIIPSQLFNGPHHEILLDFIKKEAYLQAIMALPGNLFQAWDYQKSLLLLQKQGAQAQQAKPILTGDIPELQDAQGMADFAKSFSTWAEDMV